MAKKIKLETINLTIDEVDSLQDRIESSSLDASDKKIISAILNLNFWLQNKLQQATLSILRLKKIFGLPTEKNKKNKSDNNPDNSVNNNSENSESTAENFSEKENSLDRNTQENTTNIINIKKPKINPNENHGRYAANDYIGCERIFINHAELTSGSNCPNCESDFQNGKLYNDAPKTIVLLHGRPIIDGEVYVCEKLRCTSCGERYNAKIPENIINKTKYDETCSSTLAIMHYYAGLPFKRLEVLQQIQGIPLADATQWDLIAKLYLVILPIYLALEKYAAQGDLFFYDDTKNKILSAHGKDKAVHTTSFISVVDSNLIYLFYTAQRYAAENADLLLSKRTVDSEFMTMTDASSQNFPKKINDNLLARWILCFCLSHGRRKFYELRGHFQEECSFVLDIISEIYFFDKQSKEQKMTANERLFYHQENSLHLMESLHIWLNNQLLHQLVEENSSFGKAVRYMLRHWNALTKFLHVAGAPLDNNLCEQAIKVAIRYRKSSLFYKTSKGAIIGDCMMSVIFTAVKNKVDIYDYLNILQRNTEDVKSDPEQWLPWNYKNTINNKEKMQAA